tara:strand:+ start:1204 stop:1383 length:180 start_codon:yes stop_codon:yes gene_type:complete
MGLERIGTGRDENMIYPKKFIMSELLELSSDELNNLENALQEDWERVRAALEIKYVKEQ